MIGEGAPRQAQLALATLKLALKNARERGQTFDGGLLSIAALESEEREPVFLAWPQVLELVSWMPEQVSRIATVAALYGRT